MKKIMVVDDEEDQLFTVKKTLEYADKEFNVITINNGTNCLQYLKNNDQPDLILLDIMMPEMTGWELYDKIKENNEWREIPIVFLSARTDDTAENAGKFFGEDYIEKPFDSQDFVKRINKIINTKNTN
ncbi:MAG: response regulator [Candidatus Thermoplasmatota archaeon]